MGRGKTRFFGLRDRAELLVSPDGTYLVWAENVEGDNPATWTCRRSWDGAWEVEEDPVDTWTAETIRGLKLYRPDQRDFVECMDATRISIAIDLKARSEGCYPRRIYG